jgi:hypothetical protein
MSHWNFWIRHCISMHWYNECNCTNSFERSWANGNWRSFTLKKKARFQSTHKWRDFTFTGPCFHFHISSLYKTRLPSINAKNITQEQCSQNRISHQGWMRIIKNKQCLHNHAIFVCIIVIHTVIMIILLHCCNNMCNTYASLLSNQAVFIKLIITPFHLNFSMPNLIFIFSIRYFQ